MNSGLKQSHEVPWQETLLHEGLDALGIHQAVADSTNIMAERTVANAGTHVQRVFFRQQLCAEP